MSHVDDGELTAYADGAYPANDPEALRIAAHLSTCGNCRTRLEQSHELRDRAAAILAYAVPADVAAPSFATLQAQAVTPRRTRGRTFPLAWAASIVMAIGLGWFTRDALRPPAPRMADMVVQSDAPVAPPSIEAREEAVTEQPAPATTQSARGDNRARDMTANRAEKQVAGGGTGAVANTGAAPPPSAAPLPSAPPPQAAVSELAQQRLELAEVVLTGEATEYITVAEAERRGIVLARIPELPIARVGVRSGTTIVEQVLPDEKVVTLTVAHPVAEARAFALQDAGKRREVSPAAASAPAAPPPPNVVVRVGDRSVTITGKLPPDSLRALGRKIR
jgi:hypothetical protein